MPALLEDRQRLAGGIRAVGEHVDLFGLVGKQIDSDGRVAALRAAGLGELAGGDQPGVGLDRQVRLEPVPAAGDSLVRVPRIGVAGADHPVGSDSAGDPPPRRGVLAIRAVVGVGLDELDVLPSDQREQPDCVSGLRPGFLLGEGIEHRQRVTDQPVDQPVPSGRHQYLALGRLKHAVQPP